MKLVVYDRQWRPLAPDLASRLTTSWDVAAAWEDPGWLARELPGAAAMVGRELPEGALPFATSLRLLLFPGAGHPFASEHELPAGCALSVVFEHETAIAEYVVMVALMHCTRVGRAIAALAQGHWYGSGLMAGEPHEELAGKTLGLIGCGHIGEAVARRALAFGMRIVAARADSSRPFAWGTVAELESVLAESDVLVVACPLNQSTRGLLGARQLAMLKPSAFLINVARGEIVEEEALYATLSAKRIAGAALDVWYRRPAAPEACLTGSRLPFHELDNVIATPHISGWTHQTIGRRLDRMAANLDRLARGEPLERVVMTGVWRPRA